MSNDPAVLGDNYLVDGLGKALLYVSGETMKYDFLDSTYITGNKTYDDGARDIQYFEAGSSASLASDPKDAGQDGHKACNRQRIRRLRLRRAVL